jgi:hypothetical protein
MSRNQYPLATRVHPVVKAEQVIGDWALPPETLRCIVRLTKHASAFQLLRPSTPLFVFKW